MTEPLLRTERPLQEAWQQAGSGGCNQAHGQVRIILQGDPKKRKADAETEQIHSRIAVKLE